MSPSHRTVGSKRVRCSAIVADAVAFVVSRKGMVSWRAVIGPDPMTAAISYQFMAGRTKRPTRDRLGFAGSVEKPVGVAQAAAAVASGVTTTDPWVTDTVPADIVAGRATSPTLRR